MALDPNVDWAGVADYVQFRQVVEERFPSYAWALDHPELGPLIQQAAGDEEWSEEVFASRLQATDWWTSRTAAQRDWEIWWESTSELDRNERIQRQEANIAKEASRLGVELSDTLLYNIATESLIFAYESDEITGRLLESAGLLGEIQPGNITANQTRVRQMASDYFIELDEGTITSYATKLIDGSITEDTIKEHLIDMAKQRFPTGQIPTLLDEGTTLAEYFAPHRTRIANALGRTLDDVDLTSQEFLPVLSIRDESGQVAPMTLGQVDRFTRTLDEYWQTRQGREEQASYGRELLKALGRVG